MCIRSLFLFLAVGGLDSSPVLDADLEQDGIHIRQYPAQESFSQVRTFQPGKIQFPIGPSGAKYGNLGF